MSCLKSSSLMSATSCLCAVALLWCLAACTAEEPPPNNPKYDQMVLVDGMQWPDLGQPDMWMPPKDGPSIKDGFFKEGGTILDGGSDMKPDGPSSCPGPTGVKCTPTCTSKEVCTAAKTGTCTTAYFLSGPASKTTGKNAALVTMAQAFVACYAKTVNNALCSTFDACSMTGTMTEGLFKSWMCNHAQVSDFPSAAKHKSAKDIAGCGGILDRYNMDWQTKTISNKVRGKVCVVFKTWTTLSPWDKVLITDCSKVK